MWHSRSPRASILTERVKSAVIVLLIVNAMLLTWENGFITGLLSPEALISGTAVDTSGHMSGTDSLTRAGFFSAECPFCMAVTWSGGERLGYKNGDTKNVFPVFSVILGGALGSAGDISEISKTIWESALSSEGVFFDYFTSVPLAALSSWLGVEISPPLAEQSARRLCLTADTGGKLSLYLSATDGYYRCETALDPSVLVSRLASLDSFGQAAAFVFERGDLYPGVDGSCLLISDGVQAKPLVESKIPAALVNGSILTTFQMSAGLSKDYTQQDGTSVYIESSKDSYTRLLISPDGVASFSQTGVSAFALPDGTNAAELLDFAWSVARAGPLSLAGRAELYLSEARLDFESGEHTISFDYVIDGIPIISPNGPALTLEISGGAVRDARAYYREFSYGQGYSYEKPQKQALATLGPGDTELFLAYESSGGTEELAWLIRR